MLRFTLQDVKANSTSLWEVAADGSNLHPLLAGWNSPSAECCGNWTADGKYFVFQSTHKGRTDIWAIREKGVLFQKARPEPVRLTAGEMNALSPLPSTDGKKLFFVGEQRRGELVRRDVKSGQFAPYLSGISAELADFSKDSKWVAYVTYPEGTLWRSKVDGTGQLQLGFPPMQAGLPRWSPDGKQIAFTGTAPGKPWKIYVQSADGGTPQQLMQEERNETDPGWSPDGNLLVFGRFPYYEPGSSGSMGIHVFDFRTHQVSTLPGSEGLWSPRWSPEGRTMAAVTGDGLKLMLFDFTTRKWTELVAGVGGTVNWPSWSRDGKHIYFDGGFQGAIFRTRISDHKLEQVLSLKGLRRAWGGWGMWMGLAPDDSPLLVRDIGSQEIYALDWETP